MKRAFTLVEILIVVSILGILAAVALPTFQSHSQRAKESAAKDNLRILRSAIELYAAQHNDTPPGYLNGNPDRLSIPAFINQLRMATNINHQTAQPGTEGYPYGPYFNEFPENPFNGKISAVMVADDEPFPEPTGEHSWIYKAQTKEVGLDWPGTDSTGRSFSNY